MHSGLIKELVKPQISLATMVDGWTLGRRLTAIFGTVAKIFPVENVYLVYRLSQCQIWGVNVVRLRWFSGQLIFQLALLELKRQGTVRHVRVAIYGIGHLRTGSVIIIKAGIRG